jgi:hypothetical protein
LRCGDLTQPFRGVRAPAGDLDITALCRAYSTAMPLHGYFSHLTAAHLFGFPLGELRDLRLHVTTPNQPPRAVGIVGHRGPASDYTYRGMPIARPASAWVQLAGMVSTDRLILAGDLLVRRKRPLCTLDELEQAAAATGTRGIRLIRAALNEVRAGTDSPMETRLRLLLVRGGLPEPVIGYTIRNAAGDFIGTPDLCYPRQKIAIEYEGDHHRADRAVFADDIERRELMQEQDWYVIRVISDHVFIHHEWLVARVARKLIERS